jgi:hypothetical protein
MAASLEGPAWRPVSRRLTVDSRAVNLDFGLARFEGENTASKRFAEARDRSGAGARWAREIGLVEHHHNGRLLLRGTFAGHYLDVDETDHVSQKGAGEGAAVGGLVGVLGGPPGIAVGLLLGGLVGSQAGAPSPSESEGEPELLAARLREVMPRAHSAIVLIAPAHDVDEMLNAVGDSAEHQFRQTLTADQAAALESSLSSAPRVSQEPASED